MKIKGIVYSLSYNTDYCVWTTYATINVDVIHGGNKVEVKNIPVSLKQFKGLKDGDVVTLTVRKAAERKGGR